MINKNRLNTIRIVILVMLFQLFSPTVFALKADPEQDGYFTKICTIKGVKQVLVYADNKQDSANIEALNCPYCLLNIATLDTIDSNKNYVINFVNDRLYDLLIVQDDIQSNILFKSFAIRAPPFLS